MRLRESEELSVGYREFVEVKRLESDGVFRDFVREELGVSDLKDRLEVRDFRRVDAEGYGAAGDENHVGGSGLLILCGTNCTEKKHCSKKNQWQKIRSFAQKAPECELNARLLDEIWTMQLGYAAAWRNS